MATEKNLARARRGAAWLDKKLGPGWRRKIRCSRLQMSRGWMGHSYGECGCILAQLDAASHDDGSGFYSRAAEKLGIVGERTPVTLGFVVASDSIYAELTEAWRVVLREPVESS